MIKIRVLSKFIILLLWLCILMVLPACSRASSVPPTPITLQLSWTHSAQFAGFYAAEQNGYYAAEGLAITFIEGGPEIDRLAAVLEGQAQVGLGGGPEMITSRAEGKPLRVVATVFQYDPFAFFALADSGITRPEDFAGKRIQIRERSRPFLQAITSRVGLSPDQYTEDTEANFEDLYSGKIDVAVGFVTAQLLEAERAGYKLNVIYPDDYGVHFYTDLIFTTDEFIETQPDLVVRFLRASFKGWTFALENPAQASALIRKYEPDLDAELEEAKLTASLPLINTGEDHLGWMRPERWAGMEQMLREQKALVGPVAVDQVYTLQFLQEIYE